MAIESVLKWKHFSFGQVLRASFKNEIYVQRRYSRSVMPGDAAKSRANPFTYENLT